MNQRKRQRKGRTQNALSAQNFAENGRTSEWLGGVIGTVRNLVCEVILQSAGAGLTKPRKQRKADSGFDPAALDQLMGERRTMGEMDELFRQMKKALMERTLAGELTHHLGYAPGEPKPDAQPNHRNGTTPKTVLTEDGHFPTDEAALKLLYLALRNIQTRWSTAQHWTAALPHFAVLFGDRFIPET